MNFLTSTGRRVFFVCLFVSKKKTLSITVGRRESKQRQIAKRFLPVGASAMDHGDSKGSGGDHTADYAPYPKLTPEDVAPPPLPSVDAAAGHRDATTMPPESNPYVISSPTPSSSKNTMDTMRDVLEKFGKRVNEAAKKTEDLAGNFWQHLKTGPSITDAAMGRIAQTTKVISEGGYEKIFHQTFEMLPEEKLKKTYACYLSTSAGPVMGVLYLSTVKLAFCSDNPLSYKVGDQTQWTYYKVVIPLNQMRSVNPSTSSAKPGEKYIQVVSSDNHEFWFMGLVNYDSAVNHLQEAVQSAHIQVQ